MQGLIYTISYSEILLFLLRYIIFTEHNDSGMNCTLKSALIKCQGIFPDSSGLMMQTFRVKELTLCYPLTHFS